MGDEQVAGGVDRAFNPDFQQTTSPPLNSAPGANDDVHAIAFQSFAGDPDVPGSRSGDQNYTLQFPSTLIVRSLLHVSGGFYPTLYSSLIHSLA